MYMLFLQEAGRRKTPQEASADQIDSSDRISPETKTESSPPRHVGRRSAPVARDVLVTIQRPQLTARSAAPSDLPVRLAVLPHVLAQIDRGSSFVPDLEKIIGVDG
jgi:hypothetical protein